MKAWLISDWKERLKTGWALLSFTTEQDPLLNNREEVNILTDTELQELIDEKVREAVCSFTLEKISSVTKVSHQLLERIKDLEAEREEIAREAFDYNFEVCWYTDDGKEMTRDEVWEEFKDYWQQKEKEQKERGDG